MKKIVLIVSLVVLLADLFMLGWLRVGVAAEITQSECVRCHTDVKGLIRLGWEIEKVRPETKSAETSGEG